MNCKKCNAPIPENSRFCTECGTVVSDVPEQLESAPWDQQQPEEILQDPNWKREKEESTALGQEFPKEDKQKKEKSVEKKSFFKGLFGKSNKEEEMPQNLESREPPTEESESQIQNMNVKKETEDKSYFDENTQNNLADVKESEEEKKSLPSLNESSQQDTVASKVLEESVQSLETVPKEEVGEAILPDEAVTSQVSVKEKKDTIDKEETKWIPPPNPQKRARKRRFIGILIFILILAAAIMGSWFWVQNRFFSDLSKTNPLEMGIFYQQDDGSVWYKNSKTPDSLFVTRESLGQRSMFLYSLNKTDKTHLIVDSLDGNEIAFVTQKGDLFRTDLEALKKGNELPHLVDQNSSDVLDFHPATGALLYLGASGGNETDIERIAPEIDFENLENFPRDDRTMGKTVELDFGEHLQNEEFDYRFSNNAGDRPLFMTTEEGKVHLGNIDSKSDYYFLNNGDVLFFIPEISDGSKEVFDLKYDVVYGHLTSRTPKLEVLKQDVYTLLPTQSPFLKESEQHGFYFLEDYSLDQGGKLVYYQLKNRKEIFVDTDVVVGFPSFDEANALSGFYLKGNTKNTTLFSVWMDIIFDDTTLGELYEYTGGESKLLADNVVRVLSKHKDSILYVTLEDGLYQSQYYNTKSKIQPVGVPVPTDNNSFQGVILEDGSSVAYLYTPQGKPSSKGSYSIHDLYVYNVNSRGVLDVGIQVDKEVQILGSVKSSNFVYGKEIVNSSTYAIQDVYTILKREPKLISKDVNQSYVNYGDMPEDECAFITGMNVRLLSGQLHIYDFSKKENNWITLGSGTTPYFRDTWSVPLIPLEKGRYYYGDDYNDSLDTFSLYEYKDGESKVFAENVVSIETASRKNR